MGLTTYAREQIANSVFGGATLTPPANWHFVPVTAITDVSAGTVTEASGVSRVSVTNNSTNFPNASGTSTVTKSNDSEIATANFGSTLTVVGISIWDASTSGNCWVVDALSASVEITSGSPYTIPVGGFELRANPGSPYANLTNFALKKIMDCLFGGAALGAPATWHFAPLTAIADAAAGSGTVASGVARVGYTNNSTTFPNATGTTTVAKSNGVALQTANFGSTLTVVGNALYDAGTGGNAWYMRSLQTNRQVPSGSPYQVAIGDLVFNQTVS